MSSISSVSASAYPLSNFTPAAQGTNPNQAANGAQGANSQPAAAPVGGDGDHDGSALNKTA